jgi:hypothetical protein
MQSIARRGFTPALDALAVILLLGTVGLFVLALISTKVSRIPIRRSAGAGLVRANTLNEPV